MTLECLDTPAAAIDLDRVESNVRSMADALRASDVRLRPHIKTHKSIELARMQMTAGAHGLTVATLGEADVFAKAGFTDLFLAYPLWVSAAKASRFRALHDQGVLAVGCDSKEAAAALGDAIRGSETPLPILIEIDSGGRRSGVNTQDVVGVANAAEKAGLELRGVFTYPAHGYGSPKLRLIAARDEAEELSAAAKVLVKAGYNCSVISAGSTPTAKLSAVDLRSMDISSNPVLEERPGTYIFGDRTQQGLGVCEWSDIALTVVSTVVSRSVLGVSKSRQRFVLDIGSKIIGMDQPAWIAGYGAVFSTTELFNQIGTILELFEHHAICETEPDEAPPRVGTTVYVVPNHACIIPNLVDEMVTHRAGTPTGDNLRVDARGKF